MWRDAEHLRKQAQEVERADTGLAGGGVEVALAMRVGLAPVRGLDRTAAIARLDLGRLARPVRHGIDKAAREQMPDFVEANVASPVGCRLRQFAQYHQFRQ